MTGEDVHSLFAALEAAGARLALSGDGEGLALTGKRPPLRLIEDLRTLKPALLEALRTAKKEAATASSSPDVAVAPWEDLPPSPRSKPWKVGRLPDGRLDLAYFAAQPGHCGNCARWEAAPDWGEDMGTCGCPPGAWPGSLPPLAIHAGHRCAAYREEGEAVGRGYRARDGGKRYGPRPLAPLPLEAGQVAP